MFVEPGNTATRTTYIGQHRFNTHDHKTRRRKPEAEHVIMEVPLIVPQVEWEAVQRSLKARNPKMMPPCAVGGPTLLTGICFCACCGGAMTLRTGTSRLGREYRYYTCSTKARQGKTGCPGITVPIDRLNEAVIEHPEKRLLDRTPSVAAALPMGIATGLKSALASELRSGRWVRLRFFRGLSGAGDGVRQSVFRS